MNKETILLGKLLGEVYRTQQKLNISNGVSKGRIYGLLNGIENCIEDELNSIGEIPKHKFDAVVEVLNEIFIDDNKLNDFKGFYDIEHKLQQRDVDRGDALVIIKQLKAEGRFLTVIDKMNSEHSPIECKSFNLYEWEE